MKHTDTTRLDWLINTQRIPTVTIGDGENYTATHQHTRKAIDKCICREERASEETTMTQQTTRDLTECELLLAWIEAKIQGDWETRRWIGADLGFYTDEQLRHESEVALAKWRASREP